MTDLLEFIEGQLDCKAGRAISENASKARLAGYDLEYQREEMNSNGYQEAKHTTTHQPDRFQDSKR